MKHRCATLPFHIVRSLVKRNGIVLNNFGNVLLKRTVQLATCNLHVFKDFQNVLYMYMYVYGCGFFFLSGSNGWYVTPNLGNEDHFQWILTEEFGHDLHHHLYHLRHAILTTRAYQWNSSHPWTNFKWPMPHLPLQRLKHHLQLVQRQGTTLFKGGRDGNNCGGANGRYTI